MMLEHVPETFNSKHQLAGPSHQWQISHPNDESAQNPNTNICHGHKDIKPDSEPSLLDPPKL